MPEEKKENKAVQKDSFTFSDKIKNSKPAASKSFANRISSKIGSDGKPKKTLFERTKRDAPFFIAAIVALLLLPFLYKYSGSVAEEPSMVTPAVEDTQFDPNRSGFDGIGDPEGQIAQLSGRDSMDLIVGFGNKKEEVSDDIPYRNDLDRSGLDDSFSGSSNSTERNETNVYKYRKQAAPATRAAFQKTNINPLRSAGLNSRSGGKLGVGMWGGGLKTAANKVKAEGPRTSPKPVSLQPLQAAGKPSRSYFGQGAAAEARRSKDAMSKANAMQALMDAQMKPIEPGKIGGIGGGDFGGPGGGNGNLDRKFAFNGKEPWWWDMMKKRSQMEWEAKFNRRWDWIKWADKLAQNIFGGILNCLITGEDDGDMGSMFGVKAGSGKHDTCAKLDAATFEKRFNMPLTKDNCRGAFYDLYKKDGIDPWEDGDYAKASLGFLGKRLDCLSNGLGASWNRWRSKDMGSLSEANACQSFAMDRIYRANFTSSKNKDWDVYHYVVGIPLGINGDGVRDYYEETDPQKQEKKLVVGYFAKGDTFRDYELVQKRDGFVPLFVESVAIKSKKVDSKKSENALNLAQEKVSFSANSCSNFTDKAYRDAVDSCINQPTESCRESCWSSISTQMADKNKGKAVLSIMQTSVVSGNRYKMVRYTDFLNLLRGGGAIYDSVDVDSKSQLGLSSKGGKQGKDWITGARCAYPLVRISCENLARAKFPQGGTVQVGNSTIEGKYPFAHLTFTNGMSNSAVYDKMKRRFMVSYTVQGEDNTTADAITTDNAFAKGQFYVVPHMQLKPFNGTWRNEDIGAVISIGTEKENPGNYQVVATNENVVQNVSTSKKRVVLTWEIRQCPVDTLLIDGSSINDGGCHNGNIGSYDKDGNRIGSKGQDKFGVPVSSATCVYSQGDVDLTGGDSIRPEDDVDPVDSDDCNGDPNKSPKCCKELKGDGYEYVAGVCKQKEDNGEPVEFSLADTVPDITVQFAKRPVPFSKGRGRATETVFDACKLTEIENQQIHNNSAVQSYVSQVLASVNKAAPFTQANATMVHSGPVTVANLVDALALAYQQNPNAAVPQDVVCSMGKTIGFYAKDPHIQNSNNMFGAFAAYIDENSSFFPAAENAQGNSDQRFVGCPKGMVHKDYHYGHYNWNSLKLGDEQEYGPEGRTPYLNVLAGKGGALPNQTGTFYWGAPGDFPLAAIGTSVGFQIDRGPKTAQQLKKYNGSIDDYNRRRYHDAYAPLFRNLSKTNVGCGLSGNMNVADALEYIGRVCSNGPSAKPSNGGKMRCGHIHRVSSQAGAD